MVRMCIRNKPRNRDLVHHSKTHYMAHTYVHTYIHTSTTVHSEEVLSLGTFVRQTNPKLANKVAAFPERWTRSSCGIATTTQRSTMGSSPGVHPQASQREERDREPTDRRFGYGYVEVGTTEGRCKFVTRGQLNSKEENPIPV